MVLVTSRCKWFRGEWSRGEWSRGEWSRGEWSRVICLGTNRPRPTFPISWIYLSIESKTRIKNLKRTAYSTLRFHCYVFQLIQQQQSSNNLKQQAHAIVHCLQTCYLLLTRIPNIQKTATTKSNKHFEKATTCNLHSSLKFFCSFCFV